jgi:hypothetical protein
VYHPQIAAEALRLASWQRRTSCSASDSIASAALPDCPRPYGCSACCSFRIGTGDRWPILAVARLSFACEFIRRRRPYVAHKSLRACAKSPKIGSRLIKTYLIGAARERGVAELNRIIFPIAHWTDLIRPWWRFIQCSITATRTRILVGQYRTPVKFRGGRG